MCLIMETNFFKKIFLDIMNESNLVFDANKLGRYYKTKRGFWPPIKIMDVGTGVRMIWRL